MTFLVGLQPVAPASSIPVVFLLLRSFTRYVIQPHLLCLFFSWFLVKQLLVLFSSQVLLVQPLDCMLRCLIPGMNILPLTPPHPPSCYWQLWMIQDTHIVAVLSCDIFLSCPGGDVFFIGGFQINTNGAREWASNNGVAVCTPRVKGEMCPVQLPLPPEPFPFQR